MEEAAPSIDPARVELEVKGEIGGVAVWGKVDLLDVQGCLVDVKTSARKPSGNSPDYAFQIVTYRQITPGTSGEARLDTLVKTKTVQLIQQNCTVSEQDLCATLTVYPLVRDGMRSGLYSPNRQSTRYSRRNCSFWRRCEREFGGAAKES